MPDTALRVTYCETRCKRILVFSHPSPGLFERLPERYFLLLGSRHYFLKTLRTLASCLDRSTREEVSNDGARDDAEETSHRRPNLKCLFNCVVADNRRNGHRSDEKQYPERDHDSRPSPTFVWHLRLPLVANCATFSHCPFNGPCALHQRFSVWLTHAA